MNNSLKEKLSVFIYSILAGGCISLGGLVNLVLNDGFVTSKVLGSLFFAIGLFIICTRGYNLFTGKVCYALSKKPSYIIDLIIIWIGNFLGCLITSMLCYITRIDIQENVKKIVDVKMQDEYISLFILGIICNILIFIAVDGYRTIENPVGKYLAIFLGVSVFILIGAEHCVADMFYWCMSGVLYTDFADSIVRLLIITTGNILGGLLIPTIEKVKK